MPQRRLKLFVRNFLAFDWKIIEGEKNFLHPVEFPVEFSSW
jgi:hypothetical protein